MTEPCATCGGSGWVRVPVSAPAVGSRVVPCPTGKDHRPALDTARAAAPDGLREPEPCGYCGSVDGLTPPTVSLSDPMRGETLRRLIDEVTGGLSDPRLHEVDWEAVAALAGSVDPAPGDQTVAEYVLAMMLEFQRMYGQLRKVPVEAVRMMLVKAATGRFAALAQPAPALDVGRLARAMHMTENPDGGECSDLMGKHGRWAANLARAYAAAPLVHPITHDALRAALAQPAPEAGGLTADRLGACGLCGLGRDRGIHDTAIECDRLRGPCLDPGMHHPFVAAPEAGA